METRESRAAAAAAAKNSANPRRNWRSRRASTDSCLRRGFPSGGRRETPASPRRGRRRRSSPRRRRREKRGRSRRRRRRMSGIGRGGGRGGGRRAVDGEERGRTGAPPRASRRESDLRSRSKRDAAIRSDPQSACSRRATFIPPPPGESGSTLAFAAQVAVASDSTFPEVDANERGGREPAGHVSRTLGGLPALRRDPCTTTCRPGTGLESTGEAGTAMLTAADARPEVRSAQSRRSPLRGARRVLPALCRISRRTWTWRERLARFRACALVRRTLNRATTKSARKRAPADGRAGWSSHGDGGLAGANLSFSSALSTTACAMSCSKSRRDAKMQFRA